MNDEDCTSDVKVKPSKFEEEYLENFYKKFNVKLTQKQINFWIAKHRELGHEVFQEYPSSPDEAFYRDEESTYYAKLYIRYIRNTGREKEGLYDELLPIHVAFDLGINDDTVIVFYQQLKKEFRIIHEYKNNSQPIEHYCEIVTDYVFKNKGELGRVILPHDSAMRDFSTNKTREQLFREFGLTNTTILDRTSSVPR